MAQLYALTAAQALANLRVDLTDTDNSAYRWTDAALNRAIDKAVERISEVFPDFKSTQLTPVQHSLLYQCPSNALWIDRVEYPLGQWPRRYLKFYERRSPLIQPPSITGIAAAAAAGGSLSAGTYNYKLTYLTPGNFETAPSSAITVVVGASGKVSFSSLPTAPYGTIGLNVYRTQAGGSTYTLAGQLLGIPVDLPSSFVDSASDASIVGAQAIPTVDTAADRDQFELILPPGLTPPDTTNFIEVRYAVKHELDSLGTTIPEENWDAIYLGGQAYAIDAYIQSVADNFEYADSLLRDKVDDTKSTVAWQLQAAATWRRFKDRLEGLKRDANARAGETVMWGDKPYRWDVL